MNIQLFASWDELINIYNEDINNTKKEIRNLETEKNTLLNSYNENYNSQINNYDKLMEEQKNYINTWAETEKQNQQKQTDYNINLINQNKSETQKQTDTELGNAYIDYQKGMNQYGGNAEQLASQGLGGTGFAKNTDIAMNVTYQNRVSSAKASLVKANTDYDNQIEQALLNNDAALAQIALNQLEKSYQIALNGFEYKNTLYNNKLNYEQSINDSYFNRSNTLQNRINEYNNQIANINQYQEETALEKSKLEQSYQQWLKEFEENKRQFNASLAAQKSQSNNLQTNFIDGNNVEEEQTDNTKYNSKYSPVLSNNNGAKWFDTNITKYAKNNNGITRSELESKLKTAYNKGILNDDDIKKILKSYGLQ